MSILQCAEPNHGGEWVMETTLQDWGYFPLTPRKECSSALQPLWIQEGPRSGKEGAGSQFHMPGQS